MKAKGIVLGAILMTALLLGLYPKIGMWAIILGIVELLFQIQSFRVFRYLGSSSKWINQPLWFPAICVIVFAVTMLVGGLVKVQDLDSNFPLVPDDQFLYALSFVFIVFTLTLINERKKR